MWGEIIFQHGRKFHAHDRSIAPVEFGCFVPGPGVDPVAAGNFEGLGEGLDGRSGRKIGGDLHDGGGGRQTEVEELA